METTKKLILIIDDEYQIREDLKFTLELNGYDVIDGENGRIGIELAEKYNPDLIISDIMMPELDGYGLLSYLQDSPKLSLIPFLFLSAKGTRNDYRMGMNVGADDYISKPFDLDELLKAIKTRLVKSEKNAQSFNSKFEKIKSNIYKSIPHEVRTPLNGILNNSEWLYKNLGATDNDKARVMLKNIYEDGKRLNELFEKYLFLNRIELIESDKKELEKCRNEITRFPHHIINDICLYSKHLDDNFKFDFSGDESIGSINIDESHFTKVVQELISNAIKFSDGEGKIQIGAFTSKDYFNMQIKNNGRGMSEEQIESIGSLTQFDRQEHEQKGTGVGLAIVKKVMNIYSGKFLIQSEVGKSTIVMVSVPLTK